MKVTRLTKRETDIMEIFWRSEKPLSSNDIHSLAPEISINTIQPNLRKLNERGYIEVAGVGFTRNSITREYQPHTAPPARPPAPESSAPGPPPHHTGGISQRLSG